MPQKKDGEDGKIFFGEI